ncbi:MAG: DUF3883 domain-containing protein [Candidatus Krumholzibacteria bacterium]|nr:DUF3883 domain-containing protein [Candidatus Krumholzibacteria bacterium]
MNDWTRQEVEAAVSDYFEMLEAELRGETFNKAEHNRNLQKIISRSRGSIEFKHENISAVLIELGCRYIDGYKPRRNYQDLLRDVIVERLEASQPLRHLLQMVADAPARDMPTLKDILSIKVPPPQFGPRRVPKGGVGQLREDRGPMPVIDYAGREERNRSLGLAGEHLVLNYEHERLWMAGKKRLAERIEHVSATRGDHLGYDVRSFEESGDDRLIEVKTTRAGAMQPFFVTRNELRVSEVRPEEYHLYRVHRFERDPRFFVLDGAVSECCDLDGMVYQARVK